MIGCCPETRDAYNDLWGDGRTTQATESARNASLIVNRNNKHLRPMNDRLQFRLRHLFAITAVAALLLGLWRLLGSRIGLVLVLGLEWVVPFLWRPRWLFTWFLPLVWTTVGWNNFGHPGDEYGGFFGGSLAGLWIIAAVRSQGSVQCTAVFVLAAGSLTVAFAGWVLDKLKAPFLPWACLFFMTAAALFTRWFGSFPTVERALAKNGSYEAYLLPSLNLGLTLATLVILVSTGLYRLWRRLRRSFGQRAGQMPG